MDDHALKDLRFHQESVAKDASSPLHLIREKEMEISGRVLSAKQEAETIVSDARRKASQAVSAAHGDAEGDASARERSVEAEVEAEVERITAQAEEDAKVLAATIGERRARAAEFLVGSVTRI